MKKILLLCLCLALCMGAAAAGAEPYGLTTMVAEVVQVERNGSMRVITNLATLDLTATAQTKNQVGSIAPGDLITAVYTTDDPMNPSAGGQLVAVLPPRVDAYVDRENATDAKVLIYSANAGSPYLLLPEGMDMDALPRGSSSQLISFTPIPVEGKHFYEEVTAQSIEVVSAVFGTITQITDTMVTAEGVNGETLSFALDAETRFSYSFDVGQTTDIYYREAEDGLPVALMFVVSHG